MKVGKLAEKYHIVGTFVRVFIKELCQVQKKKHNDNLGGGGGG